MKKDLTILQNKKIRDVLKVIDSNATKIAVVINKKNEVIGVVTDGDIRRGLLDGISLDENVSSIMNRNPLVGTKDLNKDQLRDLAISNGVLSIPIINNNVFDSLYNLNTLENSNLENPIFIMAGGFGTRIRPLTDDCPKPMLEIAGKPLLEIMLQRFKNLGFKNFYISTHYLSEVIEKYFEDGSKWDVNIQYIYEDKPLGTGGSLSLLPKHKIDLPLILVNGDVITNLNFVKLLKYHNKTSSVATVCIRNHEYKIPYGVIESVNGRVTALIEKPTKFFNTNAGIYVLNPEFLDNLEIKSRIDMPTLIEKKIFNGESVNTFPVHESWIDIGSIEDYNRAQNEINLLGLF